MAATRRNKNNNNKAIKVSLTKTTATKGPTSTLKRTFRKGPISSKKSKSKPTKLYTEGLKEGVIRLLGFKPGTEQEEGAYYFPAVLDTKKEKRSKLAQYHFHGAYPVRDPETNEAKKQSEGSDYDFYQFVTIVDAETDNTVDYRENFGKSAAAALTNFAKKHFKFPTKFIYGGDLTQGEHKHLSLYFLDDDVMEIMDALYDPEVFERKAIADEKLEAFFGSDNQSENYDFVVNYSGRKDENDSDTEADDSDQDIVRPRGSIYIDDEADETALQDSDNDED